MRIFLAAVCVLTIGASNLLVAAPRQGRQRAVPEPILGTVLDAQGEPVSNARVVAVWREGLLTPQARPEQQSFTTDARGKFEVPAHEGPVLLSARHGDDFSRLALVTPRDDHKHVRLRLDLKPAVTLSGRAVDSDGKPLVKMTVEIRSRAALPLVSTGYGEAFEFSSGQAIHTDAAGRFATPPVPRSGLYQATVTAPGRDRARSEWLV